MAVIKWQDSDPDIGSPVFSNATDPAMADMIVHFVGRKRAGTPLPLGVRKFATPETRLKQILLSRKLRGFPVHRTYAAPVICLADLTAAELESALHRGINTRGAVAPWAIVFRRPRTWELGFRPVVYADGQQFGAYTAALQNIHGPGWGALAVYTELDRQFRREDWTTEREWRYCFAPGRNPELGIPKGVGAIIVGRSGWSSGFQGPPQSKPPQRWLWDATSKQLVHDGRVSLW